MKVPYLCGFGGKVCNYHPLDSPGTCEIGNAPLEGGLMEELTVRADRAWVQGPGEIGKESTRGSE